MRIRNSGLGPPLTGPDSGAGSGIRVQRYCRDSTETDTDSDPLPGLLAVARGQLPGPLAEARYRNSCHFLIRNKKNALNATIAAFGNHTASNGGSAPCFPSVT